MEYIQSAVGFFTLLFLGAIFSENFKAIKLSYLVNAIVLQIILVILLIKVPWITNFFELLAGGVEALKSATDKGTAFVFGYLAPGSPGAPFDISNPDSIPIFAFGVLPLVIVISALSAVLWHWRIIPVIVQGISILFKKPLNVGGPVGLSATANIFLGQVEAPLLVRPYLASMTKHELLILMTVGMSTIAGSLMVALTAMLSPLYGNGLIGHFLIASIISVPAGIMYANMIIPSDIKTDFPQSSETQLYKGTMDALTEGTRSGLEIFLNIVAILIVVIALVELVNIILGYFPHVYGSALTLEKIAGWIFSPLAWCMGISWQESQLAGELLGVKTILNEVFAYINLSQLDSNEFSEKSRIIMLYALCGFGNFSSVGILLGGLGAIIPDRKEELISIGGRALYASLLASCMTGFMVGIIY